MPRQQVVKKASAKQKPSASRRAAAASAPTLESAMQAPKRELSFDISSIERKPARSGRTGFRATTHAGVVITWWSEYSDGTTWRDVVTDNGDGTASVAEGVRIAEDGGLIPASAPQRGKFW